MKTHHRAMGMVSIFIGLACNFLAGFPFPATSVPPDTQPEVPLVLTRRSNLSGTWTGTETLTAIGSCKLQGGDSVSKPVTMVWRVKDEGELTIALPDWPGVYPYAFQGEVKPNLSVSVELASSAMCGGNQNPFSATYESTVEVDGELMKLDMQATEVWCPGTCIFTRRFIVQRAMPGP